MKLLTFLGANRAYETAYVMPDGREHTAPYCGVALARFYPDASMRVFVTPEARQQHLDAFLAHVEDHVLDVNAVDISGGATEEELWHIFQAVIDSVEPNEEVIFDITHGFRSLPFLSFLAAAYLRVIKDVNLAAVLYGNFEARDQSTSPHRAPIVDMTAFVTLLDWMTAADRFVRFGDAQDLAAQIRTAAPDLGRQPTPDEADRRRELKHAAGALDNVSIALRLLRPNEAMDASEQLQRRLTDAMATLATHARPFIPLSHRVVDAYAPIAIAAGEQERRPHAALAREQRLVRWYLERKQYVQAMAVAREWLISWAMLAAGMSDLSNRDVRREVEDAFGAANRQRQAQSGAFADADLSSGTSLRTIPNIARALDFYQQLGDTRNDLLHAGKRKGAGKARDLEKAIQRLCGRIDEFSVPSAGEELT